MDDDPLSIEVQNHHILALINLEFMKYNALKGEVGSIEEDPMVDWRFPIFTIPQKVNYLRIELNPTR